jgi:hypothetical protein
MAPSCSFPADEGLRVIFDHHIMTRYEADLVVALKRSRPATTAVTYVCFPGASPDHALPGRPALAASWLGRRPDGWCLRGVGAGSAAGNRAEVVAGEPGRGSDPPGGYGAAAPQGACVCLRPDQKYGDDNGGVLVANLANGTGPGRHRPEPDRVKPHLPAEDRASSCRLWPAGWWRWVLQFFAALRTPAAHPVVLSSYVATAMSGDSPGVS